MNFLNSRTFKYTLIAICGIETLWAVLMPALEKNAENYPWGIGLILVMGGTVFLPWLVSITTALVIIRLAWGRESSVPSWGNRILLGTQSIAVLSFLFGWYLNQ